MLMMPTLCNTSYRLLIAMLLSLLALPSAAEAIFKCSVADNIIYQAEPCAAANSKQTELALQPQDPAKAAEAQARLNAWEADFNRREAAEKKAQQARAEQQLKRAQVEALNRMAQSQAQLARSAQRAFTTQRVPQARYDARLPYAEHVYISGRRHTPPIVIAPRVQINIK